MKKIFCFFVGIILLTACKKETAEKPQHLVSEDEMTNILYDMAVLQAMKSYNNVALTEKGINARTYIYKKYKLDSLQLVQNHAYYAADLEKYSKMVRTVTERINAEKKKYDPNKKPAGTTAPGAPNTQTPATPENRQLPLNPVSRQ
jgi:hypothetical protein